MSGIALEDPQTVPDQGPGSSQWKDIVKPLAHDVLDLTIATALLLWRFSYSFPSIWL